MKNEIICHPAGNTYVGPIATKLALQPVACIDGEYYRTTVLNEEPAVFFTPMRTSGHPPLHTLNWGTKAAIKAVEDRTIQLIDRNTGKSL